MAARNILMLVGDFVEDYEAMVPMQMLQMVGHRVSVACPNKGPGEYVRTAVHDFEGHQTYTEKPGHNLMINADFQILPVDRMDGLVIPGGRAPEYLRTIAPVINVVRHFFENGKPVACICHGVQLLSAAGVLTGRSVSCYPACATEVALAGGQFVSVAMDSYHVDGNLVTAPAWPAHPRWMRAFLELLGSTIEP